MKAVVYTGTRNLYEHMVTAAKSLMVNSPVDKVYLLIEDDAFPFPMPECVEVINLNDHMLFTRSSPNWQTQFSPYCLMRAATAKLLPKELDRVLQLDVDTIVEDSLDELWEMDLTGKYFAAVPEYLGTFKPYGPVYFNCGVMMLNLGEIRASGIDDKLIEMLETEWVPYIDQDAWNKLGADKAAVMPVRFNESFCCGYTNNPAIIHYAGHRDWMMNRNVPLYSYLQKYRNEEWPCNI